MAPKLADGRFSVERQNSKRNPNIIQCTNLLIVRQAGPPLLLWRRGIARPWLWQMCEARRRFPSRVYQIYFLGYDDGHALWNSDVSEAGFDHMDASGGINRSELREL